MHRPLAQTIAAIAAAAFVAPQCAVAAAAPASCLSAGEFAALSTYSLSSVIRGVRERCAPALAPGSFLVKDGEALARRYDRGKDRAWPGARAAFVKLTGGLDSQARAALTAMPDANLRPMVDAFITGAVAQQIAPGRCRAIDRTILLLSPLPPESSAELIALGAGLAAADGRAHVGRIAICPR